MKLSNLIESICMMFVIWSLKLALIAAGCWMMYNGWYGCGLTTIILNVFIGGKWNDSETKTTGKEDDKQ